MVDLSLIVIVGTMQILGMRSPSYGEHNFSLCCGQPILMHVVICDVCLQCVLRENRFTKLCETLSISDIRPEITSLTPLWKMCNLSS